MSRDKKIASVLENEDVCYARRDIHLSYQQVPATFEVQSVSVTCRILFGDTENAT
jgi:hypothetical protein